MGVDAMIYFKAKNSVVDLGWNLPKGFSISAVERRNLPRDLLSNTSNIYLRQILRQGIRARPVG